MTRYYRSRHPKATTVYLWIIPDDGDLFYYRYNGELNVFTRDWLNHNHGWNDWDVIDRKEFISSLLKKNGELKPRS